MSEGVWNITPKQSTNEAKINTLLNVIRFNMKSQRNFFSADEIDEMRKRLMELIRTL